MLGRDQNWNTLARTGSSMDLDPTHSQSAGQSSQGPSRRLEHAGSTPPPISQLKASQNHVRFGSQPSQHSSFSSLSDSASEYGDYPSDSEGWSPQSSQESFTSSQSSDTSTMSAQATGSGVEINLGSATPTQTQLSLPPTQMAGPPLTQVVPTQPAQMPNPGHGILQNHPPVNRGRSLRKEDTLMSIDPTQAPSPAETIAREVQALLEPRLHATFCNQYHRDRELLQMFAESIRYQMSEECAEMRHEMARLRQEVLDLRLQVERYRTGR